MDSTRAAPLIRIDDSEQCCSNPWEEAYERFETPEQEVVKFKQRLRTMGAPAWPRDSAIVELFCGRGGGLLALEQLGFTKLEGVDLSAALLERYRGTAQCYVCDCRELPFDDASRDIVIIQGGLHHLPNLTPDLGRTTDEIYRVLRPSGRLVVVEPWDTPFLRFVHFMCGRSIARRLFPKLDALATMIDHERRTYTTWLAQPDMVLAELHRRFAPQRVRIGWGKLMFVGQPRETPVPGM